MMILLASALLAPPVEPQCSMIQVEACGGMYELATTPDFQRALRRFVGRGRVTWYEARSERAQQLLDVLSGPSGEPVAIGPNLLRFDACSPHVCNIRGTLFITRGGEIQGAALLYPDCLGHICSGDEALKLTILRDPAHPDVAALARQWADQDIASRNARFPDFTPDTLGRSEVVDVPGSRPDRDR